MKIFRKKEESDEEPDDEAPEQANAGLAASVDTLKAKLEAISELRKTDSDHFSRISEEIGEIRNIILEKEKEIKELGVKATKASEMVGELQPEKILSEIGKNNVKYEQVNAKIEATRQLYEKMLEELRGLRSKLAIFQGTEALMALNKETSQNLSNIKKIEATIERQSNVVGNMFVQFQKQINEFSKEKDKASVVEEKMRGALKDLDELKIKAQSSIVDKSDFEVMKSQIELELKDQGGHKEIFEIQGRIAEIERSIRDQNLQKTAAEKLIADGIGEIKHINRIQEQEISELRRDFLETKDRVYDKLVPVATSVRNSPQPGNALKESYFAKRLEKLKRAIARSDIKTAGRIYNELRQVYREMANDSALIGKRKGLHAKLIKLYESLNRVANKK